jgi:hypothetical protein
MTQIQSKSFLRTVTWLRAARDEHAENARRARSQACRSMILWYERRPLDQVDCRVNDASRTSRVIAAPSALDCGRDRSLRC